MTGWRLGYIAANAAIVKACDKIQGQFTSGATSITQKAAVAALTADLTPSFEMVEEFKKRKKLIIDLAKSIPGWKLFEPQGAFYIFPNIAAYFGKSDGNTTIKNASDFCMYLLNTAHVSSVSGDAFGESECIRFSFANSQEKIQKAFARIKEALAKLS